ncbi:MAG: lanthionine synthetase [Coriobacteriaceae bacterium]|jgi:hypothetical protein|nr:hypothetical protein [Olsenella sp.]RRF89584.1 MAG: lanthionine synthetase [Coriobacteriaceae bacterium]
MPGEKSLAGGGGGMAKGEFPDAVLGVSGYRRSLEDPRGILNPGGVARPLSTGVAASRLVPDVFRPLATDDLLDAAKQTAAWIRSHEVPTEHGKLWDVFPKGQPGFGPDVMIFGPRCHYSGAAGIGTFFLRMWEATGDESYLADARAAADELIATASGPEWYDRVLASDVGGVIPVPGWAIGYSNGPAGEGLFVISLYEATGEERYLAYARKVADDLIAAAKPDPHGIRWSDQEDVVADGGFVFYLVLVWRKTGDSRYLDAARRAGDRIAADALQSPHGGLYWKLLDLRLIGFPKDTTFPNFSHGTAGTAWMFALLFEATGEKRYLELARGGVEYLKAIAVGDETGMLVPYQVHPVTGLTTNRFYLSSCHGPVGTVLPFRKLYELTGEAEYRDWCVWLSRGIIRAGAPEHYSWGYWNSNCQCCGTPGILEHFVDMYEFTGEPEFLDYAWRTARVLLADSTTWDDRPGQRTWYGAWTRTIPSRVVSYLGLYSGAAGCASSLVRLYADRRDVRLTQLFEYEFFGERLGRNRDGDAAR